MNRQGFLSDPKRKTFFYGGLSFILWLVLLYFDTGTFFDYQDIVFIILFPMALMMSLLLGVPISGFLSDAALGFIVDSIFFFLAFVFGLAFFAQFVLPLHDVPGRLDAFKRLVIYTIGRHGPAISIQNGEIKDRAQERQRRGPGVILLDTASGAVLRTPQKFTRAVGPGTVFVRRNERVASAFSLYRQTQYIGPRKDERAFPEKDDAGNIITKLTRTEENHRKETSGLTRDGVEVVPNIIAIFRIENEPNEGQTMFGFNKKAVWRAMSYEGIDPEAGDDTRQYHKRWDWLPAFVAAEVWRETLAKFTFTDLFVPPGDPDGDAALDKILAHINQRLRSPRADLLDDYGNVVGKQISPEFIRLGRRGLKVVAVVVSNLRFEEKVEDRIKNRWKDKWVDRAAEEERETHQIRRKKRLDGEAKSLKEFGVYASKILGSQLLNLASSSAKTGTPDLNESLELLVRGTLDQTMEDEMLLPRLTDEKSNLVDLIEWIRRTSP